jgi:hypothetical protein
MQGEDLERMQAMITVEAPASTGRHAGGEGSTGAVALPGTAAEPAAARHAAGAGAPAGVRSRPVSSDTPELPAIPVLQDSKAAPAEVVAPDPVALTRGALLGAYAAILDQIRELAPGDRSDRVAQLAEAAASLVAGEFAQRLVFGTADD